MPGPISSECSPVSCRWAGLAKIEAASESNLVDLPPSEQVSRGKELLSMLQEVAFPIGDNGTAMQPTFSNESMPPPPTDMPPLPPGFEVPHASFPPEPSSTPPHPQVGEWLQRPPSSTPPLTPSATPPPPTNSAMGAWGMNVGLGNGAPGSWGGPLSTNPSSSSGHWLSTGVSECDGSSLSSVSSMSHVSQGCSSSTGATNSHHIPYTMPPPTNADNGCWVPPTTLSSTAGASNSMVGFASMPFSLQADKPSLRNQLRAEAAPYVPMNVGIGVPAC